MSQGNNNTVTRKDKYLDLRERYTIEILLKEKKEPFEIAKRLGRHLRTIEREIKRGTTELMNSDLTYRKQYCADVAQRKYEERSKNKGAGLKIKNDHKLANYIENKIIKEKYSPDAVIGQIKVEGLEFETKICTKTLYNYIDQGVFRNITNKDLQVKKNKKKGSYKKVKIAHKNLKGTSIEERPTEIDTRKEYGHWEMDCVVGKRQNKGTVILTLTERSIREELIFKIPRKTQQNVIKILNKLEKIYGKKFKEKFKTITVDNGSEFLNFKGMEQSIKKVEEQRVKVYYAHPYSSWERGTNENSNRLIRRFIPKGADISKISIRRIKYIESWINNYPRKIFNYKSSNQMVA